MRILGIDPGTGITGFGVIEVSGQTKKLVDAGVIRTAPHTPLPERLQTIRESIIEIVEDTKPDISAIETLFFFRNVTTAIAVAHARGVVMLTLHEARIPVHEYTPLQVKMAITSYGRASKQQIQEMVRVILKLKDIPKPDDCADALAVALTYSPGVTTSILST
jgi:crossover junction endodeoxyribonuclease RuvC